jgi:hypothetical protein
MKRLLKSQEVLCISALGDQVKTYIDPDFGCRQRAEVCSKQRKCDTAYRFILLSIISCLLLHLPFILVEEL